MDFSDALKCLKGGERIARQEWDSDRYLVLETRRHRTEIGQANTHGSLGVWDAENDDLLATDWTEV